MDFYPKAEACLDTTQVSEISFLSHVSGLDSFDNDGFDETFTDNLNHTKDKFELDGQPRNEVNSSVDVNGSVDGGVSATGLSMFLKVSSPPLSQSASNSTLNESSMSFGKLEALQAAHMQDSFLNSQSEDSEKEKKLQQYLASNSNHIKTKGSLSDAIDKRQKNIESGHQVTPHVLAKELNQTELDSLFIKDIRQRLHLSETDDSGMIGSNQETSETLKEIDERTILASDIVPNIEEVERHLRANTNISGDSFDQSDIEHVQRPNLDGNSSDSDIDNGNGSTSPATTFARSGLHTSRDTRFQSNEIARDLRNSIPERTLAEGGAEDIEPYGDGGGGGDGSSGHSDDDMGGDGGVAIRQSTTSNVMMTNQIEESDEEEDDDEVDHTSCYNREQPVGGSGGTPNANRQPMNRQVQFTIATPVSISNDYKQDSTPTSSASALFQGDNNGSEQSRLSARYFLAASTPFKAAVSDISNTVTSTLPANWMNQSSFHFSQMKNESPNERTLIGSEIAVTTPSSAMLSRLRKVHGDAPDWTLISMAGQANQQTDGASDKSNLNETTLPSNLPSEATPKRIFNPFDSTSSENSLQAHLMNEFDNTQSSASNQFKMTEKELDVLLDEDEKVIAMNNNSVYKDTNETGTSEWSLHSKMNAMSPRNDSNEDGRMSVYFKAKSNELGQLAGENGPRPKFSDETQSIITPPPGKPISLLNGNNRSAERDDTIPLEAWNKTYKKFGISPQNSKTLYHTETPKSRLLKTHKRNSDTVFQKRQKRQLVGKEHDSGEKSSLPSDNIRTTSRQSDLLSEENDPPDSLKVPVTSGEANRLLESIRGRRLSLEGMSNEQVISLAKCVATLTNTDFNLVYNLLKSLPKQLSTPSEVVDDSQSKSSYENLSSSRSHIKSSIDNLTKTSSMGIFRSIPDQVSRPISSVIPMGVMQQNATSSQNTVISSMMHQNPPQSQYLQSTVLPTRSSDPGMMGAYYQTPHESHRVAASVSPVRQNLKQHYSTSAVEFVTPPIQYSNHREYFPLEKQHMISGGHTFLPLIQNDSNFSNQSSNRNSRNLNELNNVPKSSSIYPNSITYPKNILLEAACINTTVTKVFKIYNSNPFWVQCQIKIIFMACDGQQIEDTSCLSIIPKITIEPNSFEDVKLKFHGKKCGKYVSKLELLAMAVITDEVLLEWEALNSLINIEVEIEHPDIEFLLNVSNKIDFGEVGYGTTRRQELKILNKSKADIPLCLSIPQDSPSFFCFESSGDSQPSNCKVDNETVELVIPGRRSSGLPIHVSALKVKFFAPQLSKGSAITPKSEPEIYSNFIEVKTLTSPSLFVSRISMTAVVGLVKLHSLRTLQTITMSTEIGKKCMKSMPLQNAGNISLTLEAEVTGLHKNYFTVSPTRLLLQPGEEKNLDLSFFSDESITTESNLIVNLLPEGDQFKWHLHASATKSKSKDHRSELLCNKLALNWPGVSIGQSQLQKLLLRNNSKSDIINLSISVAGDHSNFQIQNDILKPSKDINKYEQIIQPQDELPIHVLFVPSSFSMIKSSLILRAIEGSTKYVIPMTGYGGSSHLEISGAKKLSDQFYIDLGNIYLGKISNLEIVLRNSGSRPAFVHMKCYSDLTARVEYPNSHVNIQPNKFVLDENSSCQITISFQPLQYDAIKCQEGSHTAAHLVIYSGDDALRKNYRRNKQQLLQHNNSSSNPIIKSLQLEDIYSNEDLSKDFCDYSHINDWENFMYSAITRSIIAFIASSQQTPQHMGPTDTKEIVENRDKLHEEMIYQTPAVKLKPDKRRRTNSTAKTNQWSVSPEQIVINALQNESKGCKLLMVNYSDQALPFEFIWPAQTLVITPSKDKIPAASQLVIRIDAKPSFLSNEEIPWNGSLYIQCNGEQKCVQVEIRKDICADGIHSPMTNHLNVSHQALQTTSHHDLSLIPHRAEDQDLITIHPQILEFPNTNVNESKAGVFTVTNNSSKRCHWVLSSIAPPYFKNIDGNCGIVRATYSAFRFDQHSGTLTEQQSFQLSVVFLPRSGGVYSQFWDFEVTSRQNDALKIRIEVIGQGISSENKHYSPDVPRKQIGKASPIVMTSKQSEITSHVAELLKEKPVAGVNQGMGANEEKKSSGVFVKEDVIKFAVTKVGETAEMKFRLCNNTNHIQKVRVSGFRSPFSVIMKHVRLSIRPMSYVRLPVFFSPTINDSHFEGLLILTPENSESICVKLVGKS